MKKTLLALAFAASMFAAAPAGAVDLTAEVKQLDGSSLLNQQGQPDPKTVGQLISMTLLLTDQNTTPTEKNKRFWLALKVHDKKEVTFSPEDLTEIKAVLFKYQSTLVAGQVIRLIDPTFGPGKD